jgi:hypothetical protein
VEEQKPKWSIFTYIGRKTRGIAKLLKKSSIKIAFRINTMIENALSVRKQFGVYSNSGI